MKKEKELQYDKYGFALTEFSTSRKNSKIYVSAYYSNNNTMEDADFTISIPKKGLLQDKSKIMAIKSVLEEKNIIDGFTFLMGVKFGSIFMPISEGQELVESLPDSIILDDDAVKQILSAFDNTPKSLVSLANLIELRRTVILDRIDYSQKEKERLEKDAEDIRNKFGL